MTKKLTNAARAFEAWMREEALPLWATTGFNASTGLSHERLLADGTPDHEADLRVRVQARQLFVFAMAHHLGWYPQSRSVGESIYNVVSKAAAHPSAGGGYIHLLGPRLDALDLTQDLYDHAFIMLGFAWCYRAFGTPSALDRAASLLRHLDARLGADNGGWYEGDYRAEHRRQNPHMHFFEAFLAAYDATGHGGWLARAAELFSLFQTRFYAPEHGVLWEFFDDDWSVVGGEKGRIVEPGHLMEWVWLLRYYEKLSGRPVSRYADALYTRGVAIGLERAGGLLYDEVYVDGSPVDATKRCWPMTELIKASIAQARAGHKEGETRAAEAIEALMEYYLRTPTPGAYIDRRGADNEVIADMAPASTLYHLIVAAAEASAYCKEAGK